MAGRSAEESAGRVLGRALSTLGREALDWLYPPRCIVCEEPAAEAGGLCAACWRETPLLGPDVCPRCGSPAGAGLDAVAAAALAKATPSGALCVDCPPEKTAWGRARAAALYADVARDLVLALKEGDRLEAATLMARRMAIAARQGGLGPPERDAQAEAPVIAPPPLHWTRRLSRRFNQSAALARALSQETGWPLALDALARVRATPRQTRLQGEARRRNLDGAFRATRGARRLTGRRVLLVDDVMTTGATLHAAAEALRAAGVVSVDALVFARSARADATVGGAWEATGDARERAGPRG